MPLKTPTTTAMATAITRSCGFNSGSSNPRMVGVVTSNFTADLGRSSGAQVTLVTKSGSNDFHGSLFEFYQTPRFHANEYNNLINRTARPQFVQHIFGGSIGLCGGFCGGWTSLGRGSGAFLISD